MPLFWIIVLALSGTAVIYTFAKASPTTGPKVSPSGKPWPGGIVTADEERAVQIALTRENDPAKLRAFAAALERYDPGGARVLTLKAHQIDLVQLGILAPFNPTQIKPQGILR